MMSVIKPTNLCDFRCLDQWRSQTGCRFRVIFRLKMLEVMQMQLCELTRNSISTQHEVLQMVRCRV